MKIKREKHIRSSYLNNFLDFTAYLMTRNIKGPETLKRKSYRNICKITGRSRGYIKKLGISRFEFKRLSDSGKIEGVRRASW